LTSYAKPFNENITQSVPNNLESYKDMDSLAIGEEATVILVVKVNARGKTTITNTASVSAITPDPMSANNSATLVTNVFGSKKKSYNPPS